MRTLTTNSWDVAYEQYYANLSTVVSFDHRFVWSELGFRYVLKFK